MTNPHAHKPPFKFATVPHGSTETNLRNNYPDMWTYMKPYNRSNVVDGVAAVKGGSVHTQTTSISHVVNPGLLFRNNQNSLIDAVFTQKLGLGDHLRSSYQMRNNSKYVSPY